jgi:uncharacterized protein
VTGDPTEVGGEPLPHTPGDDAMRSILSSARTIAIVGLSSDPERYSHTVGRYLQQHGYRVIPVNPSEKEVLGEQAYDSLLEVPEKIDVVDVFRRSEDTPPVAEDAVKAGAKVLWMQSGIVNDEARRIAEEGGLHVVMGVCIRSTHRRLGV